ncbi:MAG: exodeoxyribonuclease VII large subunit [Actinomycetota bacterium]
MVGPPPRALGAHAAADLADGVRRAPDHDVDVVVVIRGGGARSDLQAFDHERLARAIADCPLPVIVGVGHEIDHSVADEVAHTSAKTPTAAAGVLVDQVRRFEADVEGAAARLVAITEAQLEASTGMLSGIGQRLAMAATVATGRHYGRLDTAAARLTERARVATDRAANRLDGHDVRLRALDPAATLARGWSIVHTTDGRLVRSADDVEAGESLVTTTGSGRVFSTVSDVAPTTPDAEQG